MKEGVEIYGGFVGIETMQSARNWVTNQTILHGDYQNSVIRNDQNGLTSAAILDGFTISGARTTFNGGGIYNSNSFSFPTLYNTIVLDAIFNDGISSISTNSSNNILSGTPADIFTNPASGDYTLNSNYALE